MSEAQPGFPHILSELKEHISEIEKEMQSYSDTLAVLNAVQADGSSELPANLLAAEMSIPTGHGRSVTVSMPLSKLPKDDLVEFLTKVVNGHAEILQNLVRNAHTSTGAMESMMTASVEGQA